LILLLKRTTPFQKGKREDCIENRNRASKLSGFGIIEGLPS
jgi:hypothetical protein